MSTSADPPGQGYAEAALEPWICPTCGYAVPAGQRKCPVCGYDREGAWWKHVVRQLRELARDWRRLIHDWPAWAALVVSILVLVAAVLLVQALSDGQPNIESVDPVTVPVPGVEDTHVTMPIATATDSRETLTRSPTATPSAAPTGSATPTRTPRATRTATRTPTATARLITQADERQVLKVIERYEEVRSNSQGPSHDTSDLDSVLAGDMLETQLSSAEWKRENNAYSLIKVHSQDVQGITVLGQTRVTVLVDKEETREYYLDGRLDPVNTAYRDHYRVCYHLRRTRDDWRIVEAEVIEPPVTVSDTACQAGARTSTPTRRSTGALPAIAASNIDDFGNTQGMNGWQYLMEEERRYSGRWRGLIISSYRGRPCWRTGTGETDVRICIDGVVHPGATTRVAYVWRPDKEREVQVRVHAHKWDRRCGDGVSVTTLRAADGLESMAELGSFRIRHNDSRGVTETYTAVAGPQTPIWVVVDIYGDSTCDAAVLTIDIS